MTTTEDDTKNAYAYRRLNKNYNYLHEKSKLIVIATVAGILKSCSNRFISYIYSNISKDLLELYDTSSPGK